MPSSVVGSESRAVWMSAASKALGGFDGPMVSRGEVGGKYLARDTSLKLYRSASGSSTSSKWSRRTCLGRVSCRLNTGMAVGTFLANSSCWVSLEKYRCFGVMNCPIRGFLLLDRVVAALTCGYAFALPFSWWIEN